jgi:trimethylamine--corrinoid protein Co-methyltransferase
MTDEAPVTAATPRRRAGRGSGTVRVAPSTVKYRSLKHRFPATPVVSDDELEAIHDASLTILEEMGMDFMHVEAREILKKAGADVRPGSERVRFDRNLILQAIKTCP